MGENERLQLHCCTVKAAAKREQTNSDAALRRHRFHLPARGPQSIAIVNVFLELHGPRDASADFSSLPFVSQRLPLSLKPHAIAFSTISAESSRDIIAQNVFQSSETHSN